MKADRNETLPFLVFCQPIFKIFRKCGKYKNSGISKYLTFTDDRTMCPMCFKETVMPTKTALQFLTVALVSGYIGWWTHAPQEMPSITQPIAQREQTAVPVTNPMMINPWTVASPNATTTQPMVAVLNGGNVTLRVERQPLEWVLSEIARQGGRVNPSIATTVSDACTAAPQVNAATAERLMQTIRYGTEGDRIDGLLQARGESMPLNDDVLKQLYETDASGQVRLLAFETYLEAHTADRDALRAALQAALYVPHAEIQREAQQRLDELADSERINAASVQGGP